MKRSPQWIAACVLAQVVPLLLGQTVHQANAANSQDDARYRQIDERLNSLTSELERTRVELSSAMDEIHRLRAELEQTRAAIAPEASADIAAAKLSEEVARIREDQDAIQEQVKVHEQDKVETLSRYHLWINGLILFNAFANRGTVDIPDLANIALPVTSQTENNAVGASVRQTILGVNANGPHLFGAQSSADLNMDFFSSPDEGSYSAVSGSARIHTAHIKLEWPQHDLIEVGFTEPLISPLSPTSYASVAQPALAWAGNLSSWAPQIKFEHRFQVSDTNSIALEAGLWDAVYGGSNLYSYQPLPSDDESEKWPAVESRISWRMRTESRFQIGLGGYRGALKTKYGRTIPSWAFSSDASLRLSPQLVISGEFYRGLSLAGLGGGSHKDILIGTDPSTGAIRSIGLNAAGGWTQLKLNLSPVVEFNAAFGQDGGYGSDFRSLVLSGTSNPISTLTRNQMVTGNLILRPKTYLVLSPEYRRILSGQLSGTSNVANLFTISAGYIF
jgi:regulator of replication initiation timing